MAEAVSCADEVMTAVPDVCELPKQTIVGVTVTWAADVVTTPLAVMMTSWNLSTSAVPLVKLSADALSGGLSATPEVWVEPVATIDKNVPVSTLPDVLASPVAVSWYVIETAAEALV